MSDRPERLNCVSPINGRVLATVGICSEQEVVAAVDRCKAAQTVWAERSIADRSAVLLAFRQLLLEQGKELAELLSAECGKPEQEAYTAEVINLMELVSWYARRAASILAPRRIPLSLARHRRSTLHYLPRGVIGVISPWNFPLVIPFGDIVVALLAGNGVVLKPSEETPLIALRALELLRAAGVPRDLVQVVNGRGDVGQALIRGGVDQVLFTGSGPVGRKVAVACADALIPCTLELGGKAPAVVLPDANPERTAAALVWGAFANSGQICASVERVYVHKSLYKDLSVRIIERVRALRQGDPRKEQVDLGCMVQPRGRDRVHALVQDALADGAKVQTGGVFDETAFSAYPATVLTSVSQDMRIMREESFGPLLPIMAYDTTDEAIRLANDSPYGLAAYVFSGDLREGHRVATKLIAGTVMVNDVLATHGFPETPWAGLKKSGIGRLHSAEGLRDLCQVQHINAPRIPWLKRELWWFPYTPGIYSLLLRLANVLYGSGRARFAVNPPSRGTTNSLVLPDEAHPVEE